MIDHGPQDQRDQGAPSERDDGTFERALERCSPRIARMVEARLRLTPGRRSSPQQVTGESVRRILAGLAAELPAPYRRDEDTFITIAAVLVRRHLAELRPVPPPPEARAQDHRASGEP